MNFIKNIGLPKIAQRHPVAFSVAVVLHILILVGLFFSNVQRLDKVEEQIKKSTPKFIPKAVTVDLSEIKKETQRLVNNEKKKVAKAKKEARRLRVLEDKRYKKQRRINQLKARTKKEERAKKLAENKRKAEEKKAKLAENKRRKAEEKAKIAEKKNKKIEKQRKEEIKKLKKAQTKRALAKQDQLEYDKKRKAQQLKDDRRRKIAQESVMKELRANYIKQIASRVRGQWRYQGAKDHWSCEVRILQDTGGNIQKVDLKSCNIDDKSKVKSFKNAIKRAVNKASPLPGAPDKSIFERTIIFHFQIN